MTRGLLTSLALTAALVAPGGCSGSDAAPAAAPAPKIASAAGSCDTGTLCVGQGQAYPTLAAALAGARSGGVIEIVAGTYRETATIKVPDLTIRGVGGRPHFDCDNLRIAGDKACLLIAANGVTLEHLEISGAEISEQKGANGACVRNEPNRSFILRDVVCHGSQEGLLTDGGSVVIERSEFYDNGWSGLTHNAYLSGNCISVTVRDSIFRDARVGHEFKSRCRKTDIADSTFQSTKGSRNLDIPDGGETLVVHSTLTKAAGADNEELVGFTAEHCVYPADMVLRDVHIVNANPQAAIHNFDKCSGHPIVLEGVTVEGEPVHEIGDVVRR
jgi:hypothetical protein